jgi:hypothetical protein
MNRELLSDSVAVLKCIRAELQSDVESSVIAQLDKVIQDLEAAQESGMETAIKALEILLLLGSLIEKIPAIAEAIDFLVV